MSTKVEKTPSVFLSFKDYHKSKPEKKKEEPKKKSLQTATPSPDTSKSRFLGWA